MQPSSQALPRPEVSLPTVLCGPILRAVDAEQVVLWLVTSSDVELQVTCEVPVNTQVETVRVGASAFIRLLTLTPTQPLPSERLLHYDIHVADEGGLATLAGHVCYDGQQQPSFVYKQRIDRLLHGSCRRPHQPTADGLLRADQVLAESLDDPQQRPALLMHAGDQVYLDDVAGPMLLAIQKLGEVLGLYDEHLTEATISDSRELRSRLDDLYARDRLLPDIKQNQALLERFFGGVRKPIFTSSHARNHLISFSEVVAMYLLVWSPTPWRLLADALSLPVGLSLNDKQRALFVQERQALLEFRDGLPRVARVLANIPNYMIFDDHDITDDWNLSALWEQTAYQHPFSKRIVGNALLGYLLCQGWGNQPTVLAPLVQDYQALPVNDGFYDNTGLDALIERLLAFENWHYSIACQPVLLVLDTRTRRWRSERSLGKPSGLMDWEALSEFQQALFGHEAAIVVSPAPMFGVKLIEGIQGIFTYFGKPLVVDAENWMAHRGAAEVLLNIFAHRKTASRFTILSGDVHYSFVYDVRLKQQHNGPKLCQITSSGIKNQFPDTLLDWLDRLNRWLYAPYSPLNWFTKRHRFRIRPRRPSQRHAGERLFNQAGIGEVCFDEQGKPTAIRQLYGNGEACEFVDETR